MNTPFRALVLTATLLAAVSAQSPEPKPAFPGQTDAPRPAKPSAPFATQTIAGGLTGAWAIAFLPDGNLLVTQNVGTMRIVRPDGGGSAPIRGGVGVYEPRPSRNDHARNNGDGYRACH